MARSDKDCIPGIDPDCVVETPPASVEDLEKELDMTLEATKKSREHAIQLLQDIEDIQARMLGIRALARAQTVRSLNDI